MPAIDIVARGIDWLDACRSNTWQHMRDFYSSDAQVFAPAASPPHRHTHLIGIDQIVGYWKDMFGASEPMAFHLVEVYPGGDSVVLIYYDEQQRRISEFLQFDESGLIKLSARHVIPVRPAVHPASSKWRIDDPGDSITSIVLKCEARQSLGEARQLPKGTLRNALRQRAVALKALAERRRDAVG
jgi:hypothetical protein